MVAPETRRADLLALAVLASGAAGAFLAMSAWDDPDATGARSARAVDAPPTLEHARRPGESTGGTVRRENSQTPWGGAKASPTRATATDDDAHEKGTDAFYDPLALPFPPEDPASPARALERWFGGHADGPLDEVPTAPVPMRWSRGCVPARERLAGRGAADEAGAFVGALGARPRDRFPRGVKLEDFSQFWRRDARYFQFSATWHANEPPTYAVELWESPEPRMGDSSRKVPIPGVAPGAALDVEDVYAIVGRLLRDAEAGGGARGARIALVSAAGRSLVAPTSPTEHRVETFDGIPREVETSGFRCRYLRDVRALACACLVTGTSP